MSPGANNTIYESMEMPMNEQWQYQLRVYLPENLADVARSDRSNPVLRPLTEVLGKHDAALVNQLNAFESYVAEAEKEGPENFPLYKWTNTNGPHL
jgi:hypothetical protein